MPFVCTPGTPWTPDKGTPVQHSAVVEVGEQRDGYPGGDIQRYRCNNCGHEWTAELPQ